MSSEFIIILYTSKHRWDSPRNRPGGSIAVDIEVVELKAHARRLARDVAPAFVLHLNMVQNLAVR